MNIKEQIAIKKVIGLLTGMASTIEFYKEEANHNGTIKLLLECKKELEALLKEQV